MANERTFLAWVRTSIGIMAFGFVVEKFALFVKQMSFFINQPFERLSPPGNTATIGFVLVLLGLVTLVFAFIRFRIVARQIDNDSYRPIFIFDLILTLMILVAGIMLAIYLRP